MAVQTLLDECLSIRGGRLFIEECDADELARRFGTPFTVMSEDQLRRNARRYRREIEARGAAGPPVGLGPLQTELPPPPPPLPPPARARGAHLAPRGLPTPRRGRA